MSPWESGSVTNDLLASALRSAVGKHDNGHPKRSRNVTVNLKMMTNINALKLKAFLIKIYYKEWKEIKIERSDLSHICLIKNLHTEYIQILCEINEKMDQTTIDNTKSQECISQNSKQSWINTQNVAIPISNQRNSK